MDVLAQSKGPQDIIAATSEIVVLVTLQSNMSSLISIYWDWEFLDFECMYYARQPHYHYRLVDMFQWRTSSDLAGLTNSFGFCISLMIILVAECIPWPHTALVYLCLLWQVSKGWSSGMAYQGTSGWPRWHLSWAPVWQFPTRPYGQGMPCVSSASSEVLLNIFIAYSPSAYWIESAALQDN